MRRLTIDDIAKPRLVVRLLATHEPERVDDRRERIAELVGEHRQEFVHLPLALLQCFDATANSQVPCDFRETAKAVVVVIERRDDHVRPEAASVLADTPAL